MRGRTENYLKASILSIYHKGPRGGPQIINPEGKHIYPLSHLSGLGILAK